MTHILTIAEVPELPMNTRADFSNVLSPRKWESSQIRWAPVAPKHDGQGKQAAEASEKPRNRVQGSGI